MVVAIFASSALAAATTFVYADNDGKVGFLATNGEANSKIDKLESQALSNKVYKLFASDDNAVLAGAEGHIYVLKTDTTSNDKVVASPDYTVAAGIVSAIATSGDHNLVAGSSGLYSYNLTWTTKVSEDVRSKDIKAIVLTQSKDLSTTGSGDLVYYATKSKFGYVTSFDYNKSHFGAYDNEVDEAIAGFVVSDQNTIFIGGKSGVTKISIADVMLS